MWGFDLRNDKKPRIRNLFSSPKCLKVRCCAQIAMNDMSLHPSPSLKGFAINSGQNINRVCFYAGRNCTVRCKTRLLATLTQWAHLPFNDRKLENNSLIREKNSKEIMINHKGSRMAIVSFAAVFWAGGSVAWHPENRCEGSWLGWLRMEITNDKFEKLY